MTENNNLSFHGCDVAELVKEFGAPLYVMSEDEIREGMPDT